jgi:hypothetical protein
MLKRLGCVLLIAAIGCVAIAWSKADPAQRAKAETIAPHALAPSTAATPCPLKPFDRSTIA